MPTRVDAVLGVVLAFAVVASVIGVLTYEDDRGASFRIEWAEARTSLPPLEGTQQGGGTLGLPFDVSGLNLTRLELNVTVAGAGPRAQPVNVLIEVVPPNGTAPLADEAQLPIGAAQSFTRALAVPLAAAPEAREVRAASPEAAVAMAGQASTLGQGAWALRVSFAPGAPGPLGNAESFRVSVEVTEVAFHATATPVTPEVGR